MSTGFKMAANQRTSEPTNFGTTPPERQALRRNSGFPIHSRPERGPKTLQKPRPRLRRAGLRPAVAVFACVFCLALAGYVVESQCSGAALAMPWVILNFVGSEVRWLAANLKPVEFRAPLNLSRCHLSQGHSRIPARISGQFIVSSL